jgi:hypothetical protein
LDVGEKKSKFSFEIVEGKTELNVRIVGANDPSVPPNGLDGDVGIGPSVR